MNSRFISWLSARRMAVSGTLLLSGLLVAGCNTMKTPKYFPTFHMEAPAGTGREITLPMSEIKARIQPDPFLTGTEVTQVEWVQVSGGKPLLFILDEPGTRHLYPATASNQGRHIYMLLNDKPMGQYWINQGPITNGYLYIWPEVSEEEMADFKLIKDLQESIKQIQSMRQRK